MQKRYPWKTTSSLVLAMVSLAAALPCRAADDCVIVINKANAADSISASDLRKLFLGERPTWANGTKVTAVTPPPDHPDYAVVIKKTTGMSGADFKRYFIQLSFLGKVVPPPRSLDSSAAIAHFIATYPGAIGCVPAADAGALKTVKVE